MQTLSKPKPGYKLVKYLYRQYEEIPADWEIVKLIDVCSCKPQYGAAVSALPRNDLLPRYVRITDVDDEGLLKKDEWASIKEDANSYILSEGDIVFARTGSVCRTYVYNNGDGRCAFAGYLIRFIPDIRKLDSKFLFYYTHSYNYWRWIKSNYTQGVQPNVNAQQFSHIPVIKPLLNEQQKIASILSKIDELIQKTDQVIEQTQRLKKGLMQKLLTKGIRHTRFKKTPIGEIPEMWNLLTVREVTLAVVLLLLNYILE